MFTHLLQRREKLRRCSNSEAFRHRSKTALSCQKDTRPRFSTDGAILSMANLQLSSRTLPTPQTNKRNRLGWDTMGWSSFPFPVLIPTNVDSWRSITSTPTKFYCSQTVSNHFLPSRCQWKKFESRSHRMVSRSSRLQNKKMVAGK